MVKRTFSFGVQFCEFSHTHEPASFYRASQTLHCDRSEAKRFRLTLSRCSLCCRGLSGTKPAASPRLSAWTRGTSTPGAQKSPATPRAPRVPPRLAPPPPALVLDASDLVSIPAALPSPEGHGHRTLRQRPPTSETGLLRSGVPPRLAGAETRWCWAWRLFAHFYYRETGDAPSSGCAGSFTRLHLRRTASAPVRAIMKELLLTCVFSGRLHHFSDTKVKQNLSM